MCVAYRRARRIVRSGTSVESVSSLLYKCDQAAAPEMSSGKWSGPIISSCTAQIARTHPAPVKSTRQDTY